MDMIQPIYFKILILFHSHIILSFQYLRVPFFLFEDEHKVPQQ
jgi:hypothetical protein